MDLPAGFPRPPKPPESFNRSDLVRALYEHFGATSADGQGPRLKRREEAERLVICLLDEIASALERGMRVELRGLGALRNVSTKLRQLGSAISGASDLQGGRRQRVDPDRWRRSEDLRLAPDETFGMGLEGPLKHRLTPGEKRLG